MSESQEFYAEALEWLERNCPSSQRTPARREEMVYGGSKCVFPSEDAEIWLQRMAAKGWTVPTWPMEYGGGGLTPEQDKLLKKAMRKLGCRTPLIGHGLWRFMPQAKDKDGSVGSQFYYAV